MVLFFCCKAPQPIPRVELSDVRVPAYVDLTAHQPVRHVDWYANGMPVEVHQDGMLLLTASGRYELMGAYFKDGEPDTIKMNLNALPPKGNCYVAISTSKGEMVAQLSSLTPRHADHFESLVERSYYDSLTFHRVIPGFVVQGGDGSMRPREKLKSPLPLKELNPEFHPEMLHYRGALAMARMPDDVNPDKRSSPDQFYIVQGTNIDNERLIEASAGNGILYKSYQKEKYIESGGSPQLDMEYTVFGYITHGIGTLEAITAIPTDAQDTPVQPIYMKLKMVQ